MRARVPLLQLAKLEDRLPIGSEDANPQQIEWSLTRDGTPGVSGGCRSCEGSRLPDMAAGRPLVVVAYLTFGFSSSCARGSFMLAWVIRFAPVSTKGWTFSPLEAARAVLTPS